MGAMHIVERERGLLVMGTFTRVRMIELESIRKPRVAGPFFVYALKGPDGLVKYIGSTCRLRRRFTEHLGGQSAATAEWVRELAAHGERPECVVLMRCASELDASRQEEELQRRFRARLLNDKALRRRMRG